MSARLCILAGLMVVSFGRPLGANVVHVPGDHATIQEALDFISIGDTILVANGEYAEALVAPPITFWLLGDVPADTGDFSRPVVDASLTPDTVRRGCLTLPEGSAVTIERIRFRNRHDMVPRQVIGGVVFASDSLTCRDCSFDSCLGAINQSPAAIPATVELERCVSRDYWGGVYLGRSAVHAVNCRFTAILSAWQLVCSTNSLIENCSFEDAHITGLTNGGGSNVTVRNCLFRGGPCFSYYVDLVHFSGHFENNLFTGMRLEADAMNVEVDSSREAFIQGNTFYDCSLPPNTQGAVLLHVSFEGPTSGPPYVVQDNVMAACTLGNRATGIWAGGRGIFTGNRLHDLRWWPVVSWEPAVFVQDASDTMIFHDNLFYHDSYAMINEGQLAVDARRNWWGDPTGPRASTNMPGLGDSVGDNISFVPWHQDTSFLRVPDIRRPLPDNFVVEAYPNPFNSILHLTLIPSEVGIVRVELFDILGRKTSEIWKGPLAFQREVTFDASGLASGIYFARVTDVIGRKNLAMAKLVLLR